MEPVLLRSFVPGGKAGNLVFVCLVLLMTGCSLNVVYYPERAIRVAPSDLGLGYEDTRFETPDGAILAGWWVPAAQPRGTVLFCHGNGGNIGSCLDSIRTASSLGLNMLLFDYRGYGNSTGSPTEEGTYADAEAAWDYLARERGIDPEKIIIWGRSLGGAVAARTAAHRASGILIVESAFISIPDFLHDQFTWAPRWIVGNYRYDTRDALKSVSVPVLVIHSPEDEIVPYRHGRVLYESIRGPKAFVEIKGSHNRGFIESRGVYESSINEFISRYLDEKVEACP